MDKQAQRIAIAEACGHVEPEYYEGFGWRSRDKDGRAHVTVPDYLNDLNAMHEAEKVLNAGQWETYGRWLAELNNACFPLRGGYVFQVAHATAAQRAEAFLVVRGLLKELERSI